MSSGNSSENFTNCGELSIQEYKIINGMRIGAAGISFFCSLAGILIILLFKKYLFLTQRLIMYLCIAAVLSSLAKVINIAPRTYNSEDPSAYIFCSIAGFVDQYTYTALVLAIACITVDVFIMAVFHWKTTKLEPFYFLATFFLPALFAWIPFIDNAYGDIGGLCWIKVTNPPDCLFEFGLVLRIVLLHGPMFVLLPLQVLLLLVTLCILYSQRYKYDHRLDTNSFEKKRSARKDIKKLIWYPIIFHLINIIPAITRLYIIRNPGNPHFVLLLLGAFISPFQGAFITLVFVLDPETRKRLTWVQIRGALAEICRRKAIVLFYPTVIVNQSDSLAVPSRQQEDELMTKYENDTL